MSTSPMLGLRTASYRAADLQSAKAWYSRAFEIEPYFDEPFYVGFDVGGFELGLIPAEGEAGPGDGGVVAYWGVEDADAAFTRLLDLGAEAADPVQDVGGGIRIGTVRDPFGNLLGVIRNPHFQATAFDAIRRLREDLRRALHGPAWHGPALLEALADVSPAEAAARPVVGAHTITELALHCIAWTEEVGRRLSGAAPEQPERGDWPAAPAVLDAGAWAGIRAELERAGAALDASLAGFPAARLEERVGGEEREPPIGARASYLETVSGLARHHAYHGGQVAILKRALRDTAASAQGAGAVGT